MSEPLFDQQNAAYAQLLYEEFSRNPDSVPEAWRAFFLQGPDAMREAGLLLPEGLIPDYSTKSGATARARESGEPTGPGGVSIPKQAQGPVTAPPPQTATDQPSQASPPFSVDPEEGGCPDEIQRLIQVVARGAALVQAFREHGHQMAHLDPLGSDPPGHPQLDPSFFGTSIEELEEIPASIIEPRWGDEPLSQVLTRLQEAYIGSIGYEFEHLEDPAKVQWLWDHRRSQKEPPTRSDTMGAVPPATSQVRR